MNNSVHSPPARLILDCIRRIVRSLRVSSRESERELGLSAAQLFVMQKLKQAGKLSINALSDMTYTHQSSVSVVVTRLEERGFVKRSACRDDGRRIGVTLTAKGESLLRRAPEAAQEQLVASIARLAAPDQRKLAALLSLVAPLSDNPDAPAPLFFEDDEPAQPLTPIKGPPASKPRRRHLRIEA